VLLENYSKSDLKSGKWLGRARAWHENANAAALMSAKQNAPDSIESWDVC